MRTWIIGGAAGLVLIVAMAVGQAIDSAWANTAFPAPLTVKLKAKYGGQTVVLTKNEHTRLYPECQWEGKPDCPTPVPSRTPVTPSPTPANWAQQTATTIANDQLIAMAKARSAATQTVEHGRLFPVPTETKVPTKTLVPAVVQTAVTEQTLTAMGLLGAKRSPTPNATVNKIAGDLFATATIAAVQKLVATPLPGSAERVLRDATDSAKVIEEPVSYAGNIFISAVMVLIALYLVFGKGGLGALGTLSSAITTLFTHPLSKYLVAGIVLLLIYGWLSSR